MGTGPIRDLGPLDAQTHTLKFKKPFCGGPPYKYHYTDTTYTWPQGGETLDGFNGDYIFNLKAASSALLVFLMF